MTNWRNFFVLSQGHKSNKKQTNLQNTLGSELEHSFCVGIILFFSIEVFKYFSVGYIHILNEKYYKSHDHIYQFHGV